MAGAIGPIGSQSGPNWNREVSNQQQTQPTSSMYQGSQSTGLSAAQRVNKGEGKDNPKIVENNLAKKYNCQTCKNRTYVDGSNDPGVSMKTPTKISPENAASAVMGHEQQHVTRNAAKAQSEGREVLSSSVSIHMSICPECGRAYVSGGTTRTVTGEVNNESSNDQEKKLDTRV